MCKVRVIASCSTVPAQCTPPSFIFPAISASTCPSLVLQRWSVNDNWSNLVFMAGPCSGHSKHFAASSKLAAILRLFKPWKWRRKKVAGYTAPALTCEPATIPTLEPTLTCEPSVIQSTLPLICEPEPSVNNSATISKNSICAKIVSSSICDSNDEDDQKGNVFMMQNGLYTHKLIILCLLFLLPPTRLSK